MNLINKKGFYHTLSTLHSVRGKVKLKNFYAKFNEESYYNAFFRVKYLLIINELIAITRNGANKRFIEITEKGEKVWALIQMLFKETGDNQ